MSEVGLGHLVKGVVDLRNRYKNRGRRVAQLQLYPVLLLVVVVVLLELGEEGVHVVRNVGGEAVVQDRPLDGLVVGRVDL